MTKRSAGLTRKTLAGIAPKAAAEVSDKPPELKTYLTAETGNRMRNIVWYERLVMWRFVDEAIAALCDKYERRNGAYEQRPEENLRPGRRAR